MTENLPAEERLAAALEAAGFDESDTGNAVDAVMPVLRWYGLTEHDRGIADGDFWAREGVARALRLGDLVPPGHFVTTDGPSDA